MDRRTLLGALVALPALQWLPALAGRKDTPAASRGFTVLSRSKAEWKNLLEPARYAILFEEDTERAGSSRLNQEKRNGAFICAACYLPLFDAEHKYESGTGWPSFTQPLEARLDTKRDFKLVWPRTEYHCGRCGGHQGHLFSDGPAPRGERWCNNGLALLFVPEGEPLPELRT
jgi:peptide-methionine (R)-S-oxide reductase